MSIQEDTPSDFPDSSGFDRCDDATATYRSWLKEDTRAYTIGVDGGQFEVRSNDTAESRWTMWPIGKQHAGRLISRDFKRKRSLCTLVARYVSS